MVTVSIVITCYNLANVIRESVECALYQKFDLPYEVIVIDDCSTDNSSQVLMKLKKEYPELRLLFNSSNMNAAPSRNKAISAAKGEFIVSLDGDDKIHKLFLAKLHSAIIADESIGIAYSDFERFGDYPPLNATTIEWDYDYLLRHNYIPCCCLFRKEAWKRAGGYRNLGGWEDYDLWIAIGEAGFTGVRVPERLFQYRQLKNNRAWRSALNARKLRQMIKDEHPQYIGPSEEEIKRFEIDAGLREPDTVPHKDIPNIPIVIDNPDRTSPANFWGRNTSEPEKYRMLKYVGDRLATEMLVGKTSKKYFFSATHPLFEARIEDIPGLMKTNWFREIEE